MTEDMGKMLATSLEVRTARLEREMAKAKRTVNRDFTDIEKRSQLAARRMETNMAKAGAGIGSALAGGMMRAAGPLTVALSAGNLVAKASEWKDLQSRVNNAVGSMSRGAEVMGRLTDMARRTYSALDQTVQSFTDNSLALTELGYNTTQQLDLTEALNNAMVITGARGQQAESVMRAWTKAMADGQLRGENLNTVIQSGGRLAKALADSMGVSVNELRKLGAQGKITANDMFGITRELGALRAEADAMPATVPDSFILLGNAVLQFAGQVDSATGATTFLAAEITQLADDIEQAAQRWRDGEVPILEFAQAVIGMGRELGLVQDEIEDTRTEIERMDDTVYDARSAIIEFAAEIALLQNMRDFAPHLPGEIQSLIDDMLTGEETAEDTRAALLDLGTANPDFSTLIGRLAALVGHMDTVTAAANEMYAAVNTPGGPTGEGAGRGGAGASRRALLEKQGIGADYVAEQERLLSLSREQLQIEQAMSRIQRDVTSAGGTLTNDEVRRLAEQQVAAQNAGGSRSGGRADAALKEAEAVAELIEELRFEQSALSMTETQKRTAELLRRAGAAATEDEKRQITELVAAIESEKLALDQLEERMDAAKGMAKDFLGGIVSDMRSGVDGATALLNAFNRLADKLLDMALDAVINSLFENLLGGVGGGLFSWLGLKEGGVVEAATGGLIRGPGTGTSDSIPARLSNGEYVVNAAATARNRDLLEAINSGKVAAFATGGLVGSAPAFRPANDNAPTININAPITVNGSAGTPEQNADLAAKMGKQLEQTVRGVVVDEMRRATRPGNFANSRTR